MDVTLQVIQDDPLNGPEIEIEDAVLVNDDGEWLSGRCLGWRRNLQDGSATIKVWVDRWAFRKDYPIELVRRIIAVDR